LISGCFHRRDPSTIYRSYPGEIGSPKLHGAGGAGAKHAELLVVFFAVDPGQITCKFNWARRTAKKKIAFVENPAGYLTAQFKNFP